MDPRIYLDLNAQLEHRLSRTWSPIANKLQSQVVRAINAQDFQTAYGLAATVDLSPVAEKNREYIKYMLVTFANFGARMASTQKATFLSVGGSKFYDRQADLFCMGIENAATTLTYRAIAEGIARAEQELEERVAKAEAHPRYVREFVSFAEEGNDKLKLISSLHSSRLSVWGFTAEAELLGDTEYAINAVLDGRTSKFCRMIHGRRFRVADAVSFVNTVLSVQNPDDLRTVQPWPKQTKDAIAEFESMSSEELTAKGLHIPPYHPSCRTILSRIGKVPRLVKPKPVAVPENVPGEVSPEPPTPETQPGQRAIVPRQAEPQVPVNVIPESVSTTETFALVGVRPTPEALTHWNDYVGVSPVDVMARLGQADVKDVLDGKLTGPKKPVSITPRGDIAVNVQRQERGSKYGVGMIYDPFSGKLYKSYAELSKVTIADSAPFLLAVEQSLVEIGASIGAGTVVVATGASAWAYARSGFVPTMEDWSSLRLTMMDRVSSGGDLHEGFKRLPLDQQVLVNALLSSKNPDAMIALTTVAVRLESQQIGKVLLDGIQYHAELDLTNVEKVSLFWSLL